MGFLTVLVYIILSLATGILLIAVPTRIINLSLITDYVNQNLLTNFTSVLVLILVGFVILLLCFRYLQKLIIGSRQNKNISFESKQGKVNITVTAIEDLLKKMLDAKDEVSHTKIKVCIRKKLIEVQIKGYLNYEVNLVEFTGEIQERVQEKLQVLLGQDKKVQVNLQIRKISMPEGKEDEKEPEVPFRHY